MAVDRPPKPGEVVVETRGGVLTKLRIGERASALAFAGLVHVGLALAIMLPRAPIVQGGAVDNGVPGISVSLVRLPSLSGAATAPSAADQLENLRRRFADDAPRIIDQTSPKPSPDPSSLLARFNAPRSPTASAQQEPRPGAAGRPSQSDDPYARASLLPAEAKRAPASPLWPQLNRCWRADRGGRPVKLSITLDDRGMLRAAPSVVRQPFEKVDDALLKSEREAIEAVVDCAPYDVSRSAQRAFDLEFDAAAGAG